MIRHPMRSFSSPESFRLAAISLLWIALGLPTSIAAQTVGGEWTTFHRIDGPMTREKIGWSVAGAGDVNKDGHPDVVIGVSAFNRDKGNKAYVRSGLDGRLLWELYPDPTYGGNFGESVAAAGDVNADGYADLIVGANESNSRNGIYQAGSAYVFSGLDGSTLYRFDGEARGERFGTSTAGAGDVNQDGYADFIVGASGSAYVYSGIDGSRLFHFDGSSISSSFGTSVSGSEDINGDHFPDLVVGATGSSISGNSRAGSAFVYSGFDGSVLLQFHGPAAYSELGSSVSYAGDVNLDGTPDLIIGAWAWWGYTGSAYVFSGVDGSLLHEFFGEATHNTFGLSVDGAGDVDLDGYPDLIIGAKDANGPGGATYDSGSAYVYSGRDGGLLFRLDGEENSVDLGFSVAGVGDLDGDGYPEMLVGAPRTAPGGRYNAGSVFVIGIDPFLTANAEALSAMNGVHLKLSLDFPATESGSSYAVLLSATGTGPTNLNGVDIPLTADTMFNRMLTGWAPPVLPNAFGTLDLNGDATVYAVSHRYLTPYVGQTYYAAAVSFDPVSLVPRLSSVVRSVLIVP